MSNEKVQKLNQFFYMNSEGEILKYKKYCVVHNCKKIASFNYSGEKEFLYCNEHKRENMVNVKKGYLYCDIHKISYLNFCKQCDKVYCDLCKIDTDKRHYFLIFFNNINFIII